MHRQTHSEEQLGEFEEASVGVESRTASSISLAFTGALNEFAVVFSWSAHRSKKDVVLGVSQAW